MKRTVKIVRVGEERSGQSERGNWKVREVDLVWEDISPNGEPFDQSVCAQINGDTDKEALEYHMAQGTKFECNIYFGLSAGANGRTFNRIRAYFPKENPNVIPTL